MQKILISIYEVARQYGKHFFQKSNWRPRNVFTVIIFSWIALLKELILAGEPMSTWHDGSPDWAHAPNLFEVIIA